MEEIELEYSNVFPHDLDKTLDYIQYELKNEIAADKLSQKIENSIKNRVKNPTIYRKYKTNENNEYYKLYVNNYVIFYTVCDNVMKVRRFLYNRMNFEKMNVIC
jgi:plasmid stabilization system protein ParE